MLPMNEFYERNQEKMLRFLDSVSLLKDKKDGSETSPLREERSSSPRYLVERQTSHQHSQSMSLSPRDAESRSIQIPVSSLRNANSRPTESITTSVSASETFDTSKLQEKAKYVIVLNNQLMTTKGSF